MDYGGVEYTYKYKSFRYQLTEKTKGKIVVGRLYTQLINEVKSADIVLHAPGGPSIGDVYYDAEPGYLYYHVFGYGAFSYCL